MNRLTLRAQKAPYVKGEYTPADWEAGKDLQPFRPRPGSYFSIRDVQYLKDTEIGEIVVYNWTAENGYQPSFTITL